MVNNVMFQPSKLTCLKINLKKILIFGTSLLLGLVLFSILTKNCGVDYLVVLNEMRSLENSFNPEHCEYLVEKIEIN